MKKKAKKEHKRERGPRHERATSSEDVQSPAEPRGGEPAAAANMNEEMEDRLALQYENYQAQTENPYATQDAGRDDVGEEPAAADAGH